MAGIIRQLLDFSRRREPRLVAGDLNDIARTVEMLATIARKAGVSLELMRDDAPTTVVVDHGQLQQVLTNLVVNAIQASASGRRRDGERRPRGSYRPATSAARRRARVRARRGPRSRHRAGASAARLRPVLHHQDRRRGHGARPRGFVRYRATTTAGSTSAARVGRAACSPRSCRCRQRPVPTRATPRGDVVVTGRVLLVDDDRALCEWVAARPRDVGLRDRLADVAGRGARRRRERGLRRDRHRPEHGRHVGLAVRAHPAPARRRAGDRDHRVRQHGHRDLGDARRRTTSSPSRSTSRCCVSRWSARRAPTRPARRGRACVSPPTARSASAG